MILGLIAGLYLLGLPLATWGVCRLHKKLRIDNVMAKSPRNKVPTLPDPWWPRLKQYEKFSFNDKRPVTVGRKNFNGLQVRLALLLLWAGGLVLSVLAPLTGVWTLLLLGCFLYLFFLLYGYFSAKPVLTERKRVMTRMFGIANSKGLVPAEVTVPEQEVTVLEWDNLTRPQKVEFKVADTFSDSGQEEFQRHFNQIFGQETTWVPNDTTKTIFEDEDGREVSEKKAKKMKEAGHDVKEKTVVLPGWNYEEAKLTMYAVPPLPQRADWDEHYVLDPAVAWSFFPIGLGVENGIELMNPKTGEKEHVLGFDVSGEQGKASAKAGMAMAPRITTSPMCFVGETQLWLADGSYRSFQELAEDGKPVMVKALTHDDRVVDALMGYCTLTAQDAPVIELTLSSGALLTCTPDHLFRLRDGRFLKAEALREHHLLATGTDEELSVVAYREVGTAPVFDGRVDGHHTYFVKVANSVVAVHNCLVAGGTGGGKSLATDTIVNVFENETAS